MKAVTSTILKTSFLEGTFTINILNIKNSQSFGTQPKMTSFEYLSGD